MAKVKPLKMTQTKQNMMTPAGKTNFSTSLADSETDTAKPMKIPTQKPMNTSLGIGKSKSLLSSGVRANLNALIRPGKERKVNIKIPKIK